MDGNISWAHITFPAAESRPQERLWTEDVARQAAAGGLTVIPAFEAGLRIGPAPTFIGLASLG